MSRALLFLLALATTASTPACVWWRRDPKLFVYSDPPGARVFIDGQDSGFTTPVVLEPASSLRVSVEKPGYKRAVRPVDTERYFRIPKWNDGGTADFSLTLPIFFTFHDFIFPFQFSRRKHPRRLYFQLEPMEGAEVPHSTKPLLPASSAAASRSASAPASQPTSERATQPTSERASPPTSERATQPTSERASPPTSERATQPTSERATPPTSERASPATSEKALPPASEPAATLPASAPATAPAESSPSR